MVLQTWKISLTLFFFHLCIQPQPAWASCLLPCEEEIRSFIQLQQPAGQNVTLDSLIVNCLAAGNVFNSYRLATLTAIFETSASPGAKETAYVDIACVDGVWTLEHFQQGAGATTNRTDCALCISPESLLAEFFMGIDIVHHCIGKRA